MSETFNDILDGISEYNPIYIQCHDNPDADAIGAGYGLYQYFKSLNKEVHLVYSGRNEISKSNLTLLVSELNIPIGYINPSQSETLHIPGILVTVDCQYGAGNVTHFEADHIAIIDHHQVEIEDVPLSCIIPAYGSCSTLVWMMLSQAGYEVSDEDGVGTALYYGLYTDTNQLAEISTPIDRDASEQIPHRKSLISTLRNSNMSLHELDIAGVAMLRYSYNEEYNFAVIRSQPCDPNILGLIADFLLQVDIIKTCVVFNEYTDGYKLSIRSCVKEVNASELAAYITEGVGSGGGHYEKAGGTINKTLYHQKYPSLHGEAFINTKMVEYFDLYDVIYAREYKIDISDMEIYEKNKLPIGYVKMKEVMPIGTPITIRTLEGDMDMVVEDDLIVMIGIKGEVYPNREAKFVKSNDVLEEPYIFEECVLDKVYRPTVKNKITGENTSLVRYAHKCVPSGNVKIYVRRLEKGVKVFAQWDQEKYMLGKPGDFLAVRNDDLNDIYVIEEKIFYKTYSKI